MKKAIIMGASSGIGYELARLLIAQNWAVGVAARREDRLEKLRSLAPERVFVARIDIQEEQAVDALHKLIERMKGMDLYLHVSGIGWQNPALDSERELQTMQTNVIGFTRMVDAAFHFFSSKGGGHIACITSIAGTMGLGPAPAYSASKAMQSKYLQALEQLAANRKLNIRFTDIRPGFVDTPLLGETTHFPMLMKTKEVAKSILRAIEKQRHCYIVDWRWHIVTLLWQCIPNWLWRNMRLIRKT